MSFLIQSEALGLRKDFILWTTSDIAPAAVKSSKCTGSPLCAASSTSGTGLLFSCVSKRKTAMVLKRRKKPHTHTHAHTLSHTHTHTREAPCALDGATNGPMWIYARKCPNVTSPESVLGPRRAVLRTACGCNLRFPVRVRLQIFLRARRYVHICVRGSFRCPSVQFPNSSTLRFTEDVDVESPVRLPLPLLRSLSLSVSLTPPSHLQPTGLV